MQIVGWMKTEWIFVQGLKVHPVGGDEKSLKNVRAPPNVGRWQ